MPLAWQSLIFFSRLPMSIFDVYGFYNKNVLVSGDWVILF